MYGYDAISQKDGNGQYMLSKESKRHIADSFAFVAAGEPPMKAYQDIPLIATSRSVVQSGPLCSVR